MRVDSEEVLSSKDVIFKDQGSVKSPGKGASRLLLEYRGEFILIRGEEMMVYSWVYWVESQATRFLAS